MLPWTYPNLGRSPAFPEGTCLVDDALSLKHMEEAPWETCRSPVRWSSIAHQTAMIFPFCSQTLSCWKGNLNATESTGISLGEVIRLLFMGSVYYIPAICQVPSYTFHLGYFNHSLPNSHQVIACFISQIRQFRPRLVKKCIQSHMTHRWQLGVEPTLSSSKLGTWSLCPDQPRKTWADMTFVVLCYFHLTAASPGPFWRQGWKPWMGLAGSSESHIANMVDMAWLLAEVAGLSQWVGLNELEGKNKLSTG